MGGPSGLQCWQCVKGCMSPRLLLTVAPDKVREPFLDSLHVFKLEWAVLALQGLWWANHAMECQLEQQAAH